MTDIPELAERDFSRAIKRSQRNRLIKGQAKPSDIAALRAFVRLTQEEDLQVQNGMALEEVGQGGEQGEEYGLHARNGTAGGQKKSRESTGTRFLVGAARYGATIIVCVKTSTGT